jgi:hypothetical protein
MICNGEYLVQYLLSRQVFADMYDAWEWYRLRGEPVNIHDEWELRNVTLWANGTMIEGVSTTGDEHKVGYACVYCRAYVLRGDEVNVIKI